MLAACGGIIVFLLGIIAYFVKEMHADFKYVRTEMEQQGKKQVKTETEMRAVKEQIEELKEHIYA